MGKYEPQQASFYYQAPLRGEKWGDVLSVVSFLIQNNLTISPACIQKPLSCSNCLPSFDSLLLEVKFIIFSA